MIDALSRTITGRPDPRGPVEADRLRADVIGLYQEGRFGEAVPLARRLLALQKKAVGEHDPAYATALSDLALVLRGKGDLAEAEPVLRRAAELRRDVLGGDHPDHANAVHNLGEVLFLLGDPAGAEPLLRRAVDVRRKVLGDRHPDSASSLTALAVLLQENGEAAEAEDLFRRALEVRREAQGEDHPQFAAAASNLALLLQKRGDPAGAEPLLRRAVDVLRRSLGGRHPEYARALHNLALLVGERGRRDEAEALAREASAVGGPLAPVAPSRGDEAEVDPAEGRDGREADDRPGPGPGPVAPLTTDPDDLAGALTALAEKFEAVGGRLVEAGRRMQDPGLAADPGLFPAAAACDGELSGLRASVLRLAADLDFPAPDPSGLASLRDLAALLGELSPLRARQKQAEASRRNALDALDRVLSLRHRGAPGFAPLLDCQETARGCREALLTSPWDELPPEAGELERGEHPLARVVTLATERDRLRDQEWADLQAEVTRSFGPDLGVAIARGRIAPSAGEDPDG